MRPARAMALALATVTAAAGVLLGGLPAAADPARLDEGSLVSYDRATGALRLSTVGDDGGLTVTWSGSLTPGYTHVVGGSSYAGRPGWEEDGRYELREATRVWLYDATDGRWAVLGSRGADRRPAVLATGRVRPGYESVMVEDRGVLLLSTDGLFAFGAFQSGSDGLHRFSHGRIAAGYRVADLGTWRREALLHSSDGRWAIARVGPGRGLAPRGVSGRFAVGYEVGELVRDAPGGGGQRLLLYSRDDGRYAVVSGDPEGVEVFSWGQLAPSSSPPSRLDLLGPANGSNRFVTWTDDTRARRHSVGPGWQVVTGAATTLPQRTTATAWVSHLPAPPPPPPGYPWP